MRNVFLLIFVLSITFMNAQTRIIAHRGYFQTQPPTAENSLKALQNAQALKVYGSEFDVRRSADGVLVVNHDEHHGDMEIAETPYADLKKLMLSNGEKLPTLKQYLKHGKRDPEVKLIVELKPAKTKILEDEIVKQTLQLVKKLGLESQTEFISFSLNICREIRKQEPDSVVHYLNGDLSPQQLKAENLNGLDYHYKLLTEKHPEWIREARALGLKTNAWTVNDPEIYQQLKNQGIDFVTTNIPEQLLKN